MRKLYLLICAALSLTTSAFTQSTFIKGIGSVGELHGFINTLDGGYAILGATVYADSTNGDACFIKLDVNANIEWQRSYGSKHGAEHNYELIQQTDGSYFLTGRRSINDFESWRFHIMKIDVNGELLWTKYYNYSYGGFSNIIGTNDGGAIFTNWLLTDGNAIIKIDEDGDVEWSKSFEYIGNIIKLTDGNFMISGINSFTKIDVNGNILWSKYLEEMDGAMQLYALDNEKFIGLDYNISENKPILTKFNSDGSISWSHKYNFGPAYEGIVVYALAPAEDGGFYMGGYAYIGTGGSSSELPVLVKVDSLGNFEWGMHPWDELSYALVLGMVKADDGSVMMLSEGPVLLTGFYKYIIKCDADGNTGCETLPVVAYTLDGISLVSDTTFSFSLFDVEGLSVEHINTDYPDGIDSLYCGNIENPPCATAPTGLYANSITTDKAKLHWDADPDAIKYKVQYRPTTSPSWISVSATSNVKKLAGLAANTTYKYRVRSQCSATLVSPWSAVATFTTLPLKEGVNSEGAMVTIYPNPAHDEINLELSNSPFITDVTLSEVEGHYSFITHLNIYDITGRLIKSETVNSDRATINVQSLSAGIYLIEFIADGMETQMQKVIIE